jgi:hypothetical protein
MIVETHEHRWRTWKIPTLGRLTADWLIGIVTEKSSGHLTFVYCFLMKGFFTREVNNCGESLRLRVGCDLSRLIDE